MSVPSVSLVVGVSFVVVGDVAAWLQSVLEKRLHIKPKNTHVHIKSTNLHQSVYWLSNLIYTLYPEKVS